MPVSPVAMPSSSCCCSRRWARRRSRCSTGRRASPRCCSTPTSSRSSITTRRPTGRSTWSWSTSPARAWRSGSQREAPLPLDIVVGIVDQIAAGLSAAHASRVVHRDLKPDNVFLVPVEGREAESVKILDFGISKVKGSSWGRQAPEGTVMGTPLYMAPEQIEGRVADADGATDQFALAVIAYEMLTGRNPFQAETAGEVFALVLHTEPPPMGVGRDVELVVRRGLAKSNRQRFPTITDFSDALRAAAAGRSRETQWAATVAYAAGEVASHDSMGRSGRRPAARGADPGGGRGHRDRLCRRGGVESSRVAPRRAVPVRGGGGRRRDRGTARRPGSGIARRPGSGIERRPGRRRSGASRGDRGCSGAATADCARDAAPSGPPPGSLVRPAEICSSRFLDPGRRCDAARHRAVELNGHLIHIDLIRAASGEAGGPQVIEPNRFPLMARKLL